MLSMTVLTDGRKEYIAKALPSWIEAYGDKIQLKAIIDDSGNTGYRHWLQETFPDFIIVAVGKDRCGYAEAMRKVFEVVREFNQPYNLHVEDDFIVHTPPDLDKVCSVLDAYPNVSQMAFMRQPWYPNEIKYGGVIEALEAQGVKVFNEKKTNGNSWVRHIAFWTANPSVFPQWLAHREWPDAPWCEMHFSKQLKRDKKMSGIWGSRGSWVCVEHIGEVRSGNQY
jgi:hypothetical protein